MRGWSWLKPGRNLSSTGGCFRGILACLQPSELGPGSEGGCRGERCALLRMHGEADGRSCEERGFGALR